MIIGLTGKKQSGKSTSAQYIEETYNARRINMKDGLLRELKERLGDTLKEIVNLYEIQNYDGRAPLTVEKLLEQKPPVIRKLMQNYGTEVRRRDNPNYWVDQWTASVMMNGGRIVCDDVRFLNEADAVRNAGGIIIRIERNDQQNTDGHISETEMDSIIPDYTIKTSEGDFGKLFSELDFIIEQQLNLDQYEE